MGAGAPSKYNQKYHDPWAFSLACDGKTDEEIAAAMGVSERTINRWKFVYKKVLQPVVDGSGKPVVDKNGKPKFKENSVLVLNENGEKMLTSFGEQLLLGKSIADAQVEKKLFESCIGFDVEEKEELVEVDRNGKAKPLRIKKTTRHVPPNVMAQMYWLNNRSRRSGKWSQRQDVTLTSSGGVDVSGLSDDELRRLASMVPPPE